MKYVRHYVGSYVHISMVRIILMGHPDNVSFHVTTFWPNPVARILEQNGYHRALRTHTHSYEQYPFREIGLIFTIYQN